MKSFYWKFILLCFAISGLAIAQQDESMLHITHAQSPAVFVATGAAFDRKRNCATTRQLLPNKKRKPKAGTKSGRS